MGQIQAGTAVANYMGDKKRASEVIDGVKATKDGLNVASRNKG